METYEDESEVRAIEAESSPEPEGCTEMVGTGSSATEVFAASKFKRQTTCNEKAL